MSVDPARCTGLTAPRYGRARAADDPPMAFPTSAGDVVLPDLPAPSAGRDAAALDELLEPLEISLCLPLDEAEGVSDRLDRALRLDVELQGDPGPAVVEAMELHHARILRPF